ncbi:hypothetical protein Dfri01_57490 [Dyadobacter frigoris]|nr:hypothetical protein Dfri01_57490 [Dyadobacter frigoris]
MRATVKLISFSAKIEKDILTLNWITSSENNINGFEVQKSLDTKSFQTIGIVKGDKGSKTQINYCFDDNELPAFSTLYYRLKEIDKDGAFQYSRVIAVSGQELGILMVFPDPGDGVFPLSIENTKSFEVRIMDTKGNQIPISRTITNNTNDITVHPKGPLKPGFYQLKVISDDGIKVQMMKVVVE